MTTETWIASVIQRGTFWRITATDGGKYATNNPWLAGLADQYRKTHTLVRVGSDSGWFYRTLTDIAPVPEDRSAA